MKFFSQTIDPFNYCCQYQRYLNQTYKYFQNQKLIFNGQF